MRKTTTTIDFHRYSKRQFTLQIQRVFHFDDDDDDDDGDGGVCGGDGDHRSWI